MTILFHSLVGLVGKLRSCTLNMTFLPLIYGKLPREKIAKNPRQQDIALDI